LPQRNKDADIGDLLPFNLSYGRNWVTRPIRRRADLAAR
jgi:hypothetical protein